MDSIEALEDLLMLEVAPAQIRGCGQPVEIVDIERGRLVGGLECVVRVTPRPSCIAIAAVLKVVHLNHTRAEPDVGPSS
jgi:hypothetical protein